MIQIVWFVSTNPVRLFNGIGKSLNYPMRARPESRVVMARHGLDNKFHKPYQFKFQLVVLPDCVMVFTKKVLEEQICLQYNKNQIS